MRQIDERETVVSAGVDVYSSSFTNNAFTSFVFLSCKERNVVCVCVFVCRTSCIKPALRYTFTQDLN